jgi:release factor glutamine methyltransferase
MMENASLISFRCVLEKIKKILSTSPYLMERGGIQSEAELLVMDSFRRLRGRALSRAELYAQMNSDFPADGLNLVLDQAQKRAEGHLLQHLTEIQTFLDHDYVVGPGVLIPRPETEILVLSAVEKLMICPTSPAFGIEIGVGSGILSIELLSHFPQLEMFASERCEKARHYAEVNGANILGKGVRGNHRFHLVLAREELEVFEPFKRDKIPLPVDFIITNPPYLSHKNEVDEEVLNHEPAEALFAPQHDPVYFYRRVAEEGASFLKPLGYVFAELPHERALEIQKLFQSSKWESQVLPDLTGRDRVLIAQLRCTTKV